MDQRGRGYKAGLLLACLLLAQMWAGGAAAGGALACRLVILGDSLTSGYGVAAGEGFPARLEAALKAQDVDCAVIDAGVSGDTSAGGAARIEWVLADQPTHLLVELGGNDALRALPVEQLRANLAHIIQTAEARDVEVMLAGMMAPPNLGREYGAAFKAVYEELARAFDIPLYPFFLDGAILQPELMQPDGIHPNHHGVEIIVQRIAPAIVAWLRNEETRS